MFKRIQRAEEFSNQIGEIFGTIEKGKARNVTFVVTEKCNLSCAYCVDGETLITMSDLTTKKIKEIKVGDTVLGFNENKDGEKI